MNTFERKKELIVRDPLTRKFEKQIHLLVQQKGNKKKETYHETGEFFSKLQDKWNIPIFNMDTGHWPLLDFPIFSRSYLTGHKIVIDAIEMHQLFKEHGKFIDNVPSKTGCVYFRPHELPIIIDLSTLTLNDSKKVKNEVWDITKKALNERRRNKNKELNTQAPPDEPEELGFIYHSRDETFNKYLRWYLLASGNQ